MSYLDKDLAAGGTIVGSYQPVDLFAGDAEIVTEPGLVSAFLVLAKHTVVGQVTESGLLVAYNPFAADGSQVAFGILTQAVQGGSNQSVGVYTAGFFNADALVWPNSIASLMARKMAFKGTTIHIGSLNKSLQPLPALPG